MATIPKWGFGMAPLKAHTEEKYRCASTAVADFLETANPAPKLDLDCLAEFKGMVNRCVRQDQWDWFTVYSRFGEPDPARLRGLSRSLEPLRRALQDEHGELCAYLRWQLVDQDALSLCDAFLGRSTPPQGTSGTAGYVYILSTRDQPDLLKIGMTTRSVAERVAEINSATGLLVPFGARRVFKVSDARRAEREVFLALAPHRVRPDREFFLLPFSKAAYLVEEYLEAESHLSRSSGTVVWYSPEEGYGFIRTTVGAEVFVHWTEVPDGHLTAGAAVVFDIGRRPQGPCARRVSLAKPSEHDLPSSTD